MFQVGNRILHAKPGYAIDLPAGIPHAFAITSHHAKFLVWVSNSAAERYIEELAEAGREQALTEEQVQAITEKYHIRYAL